MSPPYLDIRDPDKAAIVGRVVDGRQVVLAARHVDRNLYRHWYSPMVWLWGDSRGNIMLDTDRCGRIAFYVMDSRYASCPRCELLSPLPKDCPLNDPATREQWSNAAWRILE